jgi:hypothetical protein
MRHVYQVEPFPFSNLPGYDHGDPIRIVIHRNGNPGAKALPTLNWGNINKKYSIHSFIGETVAYDGILPTKHAYHVLETRKAKEMGYPTHQVGWRRVWKQRGDIRAIGIETEDEGTKATYWLSHDTRITLLLRTADYIRQFPAIDPMRDIHEHAMLDPWTRSLDLGNALNMIDFRLDLEDELANEKPWRTVGRVATGRRAPESWKDDVLDDHAEALAELRAIQESTKKLIGLLS